MLLLLLALQTAEVGPAKITVVGGGAEIKKKRGEPLTEIVPGPGSKTLRVDVPSRYVVLPDFFSDDLVFDPTKLPGAIVELPSENFLLHLAGDGKSIVMVVFENRDQDVKCRMSKGQFQGSEIEFGGKKIWVASLEAPKIWHSTSDVKPGPQKLDWTMPWPAQWRVDFTRPDELTDSWDLLLQKTEGGEYTKPSWMGAGAEKLGAARKRWTTVLGSFLYPCWSDPKGVAYLEPLRHEQLKLGGPVVIYPANRVPETPLDAFTVLDVARAALGAGPCEYILDLDNQKSSNKGHATCWTRDWLHPVYQSGQQKAKRAEVEKNLDQVLVFVKNIRGRITRYSDFLRETRTYLAAQAKANPGLKKSIDALDAIAQSADKRYKAREVQIRTVEAVEKLTADFRGYEGPDAFAKCKAYTDVLVEVGDNQDQLAGELRWEVRALRQRAGLLLAAEPKMAEIAAELRKRTQDILRGPAGHEGARH
ncbi:MAG TPA: hypothetical protein VF950_26505 [Planctomycetota bacterium]